MRFRKPAAVVRGLCLAVLPLSVGLIASTSEAAPNNAPSFTPGPNPTSSACDGEVRIPGWAQSISDGDGMSSGLNFRISSISNGEVFSQYPFVSWPSRTLTYSLIPGTPGGLNIRVSAVLIDSAGTGQGGSDTSAPQSWNIFTRGCTDVDLDGIADEIDPEIDPLIESDPATQDRIDTDGDGIFDDADLDDDNDGIPDSDEGSGVLDTDDDGVPDSLDLDSDNDGLTDVAEGGNAVLDSNGDGMIDGDVDGSGNPVNADGFVTDTDSDGIPDSQEPNGVDVSTDTDGDGLTDDVDTDDDNDGISDIDEGDGAIDSDGDGIPDSLDPAQQPTSNADSVVTVQSGPINSLIETGLSGGGCTFAAGRAFDPLFLLTGLMAVLGLRRRKFVNMNCKDKL